MLTHWACDKNNRKEEGIVMKKRIVKRLIASALVIALTFGLQSVAFAAGHAPNGADVMPNVDSTKWTSFSVCYDPAVYPALSEWEQSLIAIGQVKGTDYATEGWIDQDHIIQKGFNFYAFNTGWDGEYSKATGKLIGDNPWGLRCNYDGIPVEFGRKYTVKFKLASTLKMKDEETGVTGPAVKHIKFKAYDYQSPGGPAAEFLSIEGAAPDGTIELQPSESIENLVFQDVTAEIQIPNNRNAWSNGKDKGSTTKLGLYFAFGALLVSYDKEIAMTGTVYARDIQIIAGTQHEVTYYDGTAKKATRYVNDGGTAPFVSLTKKGKTLNGYTKDGYKYSFSMPVTEDTKLVANWVNTPKPAKAKFSAKSKKKKTVTVTFKKNTNAKGYQVKYSYKKSMKKAKTKTTSSTKSYKITKLKRGKIAYIKARAYNKDSAGYKVYGKWSGRKSAFVK